MTEEQEVKQAPTSIIGKILLLGDAEVGKTCLLTRYTDDSFSTEYKTTIGIDFRIKRMFLSNQVEMKLQVWDTAGQERFRNISKAYVRGASAICLVYDVTKSSTFKNLHNHLSPETENPEVVKFIVGNKCEKDEERQVTFDEGKAFADEKGYEFREVSAASDTGVDNLFISVAKAIYRQKNPGSSLGWTGSASKFFRK
ncbi:uncharacterized protein LOC132551386 [Ylistrum balloti]|uniref:uncharacterized protein LOC132551386 n=1 Tax=Ylistrum balloti TaxID=509963 RepID=UPI002905995C|nr:uncharacterized protein LOC132551386 [Ylistrum balloti]